jgi:hypothetical protein
MSACAKDAVHDLHGRSTSASISTFEYGTSVQIMVQNGNSGTCPLCNVRTHVNNVNWALLEALLSEERKRERRRSRRGTVTANNSPHEQLNHALPLPRLQPWQVKRGSPISCVEAATRSAWRGWLWRRSVPGHVAMFEGARAANHQH